MIAHALFSARRRRPAARALRRLALLAWLPAGIGAAAEPIGSPPAPISEDRVERLFRPFQGEMMALSTDGRYLAYTEYGKDGLVINVLDTERLSRKTRILAEEDRPVMFSKEKARAQLRFMEWASGTHLIYAPTIEIVPPPVVISAGALQNLADLGIPAPPQPRPKVIAPIVAIDVESGTGREILNIDKLIDELASPTALTPDPKPVGFVPGDRNNLILEVRHGEGTEIFRLDVQTGKLSAIDDNPPQGRVVADRLGRARLIELGQRRGLTRYYEYRVPNSQRWTKLPEPLGGGAPETFATTAENYFGQRAFPLGFDYNPNVLIYASNVGRDTFGVYAMDLTTRQRTALVLEHPQRDLVSEGDFAPSPGLVYDKFRSRLAGVRARGPRPLTVWADPELAQIQRDIDEKFPQRSVQILEWDEARTRFLTLITGGTEQGRIFLFKRQEGLMVELMRRTPWPGNAELHDTKYFEFATPDGTRLTGHLTTPRHPRLNPPPVLVWLAPGLPPSPHPEYSPQAQVFADMGFVVCRLNNRGVSGLGTRHRDALRADLDRAAGVDAIAALDWIAGRQKIDRRRVVIVGEGFAAHLALRATQLHPQAFRCAVVFDPIISLISWTQAAPDFDGRNVPSFDEEKRRLYLQGKGAAVEKSEVTAHPDELNAGVFIVTSTVQDPRIASGISLLRSQLKRRDLPVVEASYNKDFSLGLPAARTRLYRQMEEFLNLNLYDYKVNIGPTKEVK